MRFTHTLMPLLILAMYATIPHAKLSVGINLIGVRMEDPIILVTLLKITLLMVMLGAAIAIFREIILMARGVVLQRPGQDKAEE
jgi:hypothetical protein